MDSVSRTDIMSILEGCPNDVFYIAPTPIILDSLFIQVNRAGIALTVPENFHITRDDSYRYSVIHCVMHGKGLLRVRGREYELSRGKVFFLTANEAHEYLSDPKDPLSVVWVEFAGGNSSQIVKYILDSGGPVYEGSLFLTLTNMCTSVLYQTNQRTPKISSIIFDMLMQTCSSIESDLEISTKDQDILRYINSHLSTPLTLNKVAEKFGYNPTYFSARFSKTCVMSFSKYLLRQRMRSARYMLLATNWPIERIALELGFYDTSHFIQRFKSIENITPNQFRHREKDLKVQSITD